MKKMYSNRRTTVAAGATATVAMLVTLASCAVGKSVPLDVTKGTVIQNVTVVSTRDGSLLPGMTIVIDQRKIQRITAMPIRASGTAQAIDVSGKYAVPGFLDMHAHVVAGADLPITPRVANSCAAREIVVAVRIRSNRVQPISHVSVADRLTHR